MCQACARSDATHGKLGPPSVTHWDRRPLLLDCELGDRRRAGTGWT